MNNASPFLEQLLKPFYINKVIDENEYNLLVFYFCLNKSVEQISKEKNYSIVVVNQSIEIAQNKVLTATQKMCDDKKHTEFLKTELNNLFSVIVPIADAAKLILKESEEQDSVKLYKSYFPVKPIPLTDFDLSVRTLNALAKVEITTLLELRNKSKSELLNIRNFGKKCLTELEELFKKMGIKY